MADKTHEQIIADLQEQNGRLTAENERLGNQVKALEKALKSGQRSLLDGKLQKLVDAKRAAGLTFEQALEVAQRQLENDRQKRDSTKAD